MIGFASEFESAFAAAGLGSTAAVCQRFGGDALPPAGGVQVKRVDLELGAGGRLELFFKLYCYRRPSWRFFGRASKARREFQNYAVFERLGIRGARRVACGEERDWIGRLRRAFIVTEAIPGAVTLTEFVRTHAAPGRPGVRALRLGLLRQLAAMICRAHAAGFYHHDLVWRNLLVTHRPPGEPQVWWIDCPRGQFDRWSPWRERRRIKDLASLDKVAAELATAPERLRFVMCYLGMTRLDREAKSLVRRVLAYRKARWPDDWR
jgi:hypothetical protein